VTRLDGARSEQVATVTPSPPASVSATHPVAVPAVDKNQQRAEASEGVSTEKVKAAAEQIESYLKSIGRALEFRVDESSGRTIITVRDSSTGEIIRQIPGEESLRLARSIGDAPTHALVDLAV
jgi:flagellar protein FlaG